jgi:hypothetical protein
MIHVQIRKNESSLGYTWLHFKNDADFTAWMLKNFNITEVLRIIGKQ